jgi:hypothetical protein
MQQAKIENMDDGDEQVLPNEGRNGYLYFYTDEKGSTINQSGESFAATRGGARSDGYALRIKGEVRNGDDDSYAGMGFSLMEPPGPYDASKYTGVAFIAKAGPGATHWVRFQIADSNTDPQAGVCKECDNDFGVSFQLTDKWTRYEVQFADLKQEGGWGDPQPKGLDAKHIWGMKWNIGDKGKKYDLWVDEVTFISDSCS